MEQELRNALDVIKGYAECLEEYGLYQQAVDAVEKLEVIFETES